MCSNVYVLFLGLALSTSVGAQTAVTTAGGTANTVPMFTGTATLGGTPIVVSNGNVGIGLTTPAVPLDVSGYLHVTGSTAPVTSGQGAYLGWNALNGGGVGETDLINNQGLGSGGFAFMNTPPSGSPRSTLMFLNGANGNVGIGATTPMGLLDVNANGGLVVSGSDLDPKGGYSLSPLKNTAKLLVGWNYTGGAGETDFIQNPGPGGPGGFIFFQYSNAGVLSKLLTIGSDGGLAVGHNINLTQTGSYISFPDSSLQSTAWTGILSGGDYAESVDVSGDRTQYEPGDVLVIDPAVEGKFLKSTQAYSTSVMGIYSTRPGVVGRRQASDKSHMKEEVPMAMVGVVPTKVSTEGGAIKPGDLLVTSSTPGYAMKGSDRSLLTGAIIGKALGHLDAGKGVIEVAVSIQ